MTGPVLVKVLYLALAHFGSITKENTAEVALWVQRKVREIDGGPAPKAEPRSWHEPRERDAAFERLTEGTEDGWK